MKLLPAPLPDREADAAPAVNAPDSLASGRVETPTLSQASAPHCRRDEQIRSTATAFLLSLIPGCGHLYAGRLVAGVLWSGVFLAALLPGALLAYVVWSFSTVAAPWILLILTALLLCSGLGPAATVWSQRGEPLARGVRMPAIAAYGCIVVIAILAVSAWILSAHISTAYVRSRALEPLFQSGDRVVLLSSRFIRPVHGEVIAFARAPGKVISLGRVLATPRDTVALSSGQITVNGLRLDLSRTDQRRSFERAGRRHRTVRTVHAVKAFFLGTPAPDTGATGVQLVGDDWHLRLPRRVYLVLPDLPAVTDLPESDSRSAPQHGGAAWFVDAHEVLGRATNWTLPAAYEN